MNSSSSRNHFDCDDKINSSYKERAFLGNSEPVQEEISEKEVEKQPKRFKITKLSEDNRSNSRSSLTSTTTRRLLSLSPNALNQSSAIRDISSQKQALKGEMVSNENNEEQEYSDTKINIDNNINTSGSNNTETRAKIVAEGVRSSRIMSSTTPKLQQQHKKGTKSSKSSKNANKKSDGAIADATETSPASPSPKHRYPLGIFKLSTSPINMFLNNKVSSSSLMMNGSHDVNGNQQMTAAFVAAAAAAARGSPARRSSSLRNFHASTTNQFPVTRRQVRDSGSFLFMLAYVGFLVYIIWEGFSSKEANVQLIIHGHDSFGNICGQNNKPIRFVDKSGKNYSSKPYTKYTLINAQFERYTLLTDKSLLFAMDNNLLQRQASMMNLGNSNYNKLADFYYVKESSLTRHDSYNNSTKNMTSQANLQLAPASQSKSRIPRSVGQLSSMVSFDDIADDSYYDKLHMTLSGTQTPAQSRDQKHQNHNSPSSLYKTSLMYQYPSEYQSQPVSMVAPTILAEPGDLGMPQRGDHRISGGKHGSFTEVIASPSSSVGTAEFAQPTSKFSPKIMINGTAIEQQARSTNAWQRNLNSPLATGSSNSNGKIGNSFSNAINTLVDDLMSSQSITSNVSAMDRSSTTQVPATNGGGSSPPRGLGQSNFNANETSNELDTNGNNNLDHVLISRTQLKHGTISSSGSPSKIPEILSQNEANQQLLYLTECVDTCPADHLELIFFRCLPKNWRFSLFPNAINVTRTFIDDVITDIGHCHRELIYTFSFALALSIILLILLRFLASFIIWSSIAFLISLVTSTAAYSWINYYYQIIDLNDVTPHESSYSDRLALSDKWLIGSIFLTFMSLAGIVTVIFMRRRILLVTTLFRESGKAIADMPLLLLQPLLTFTALILIVAAWCLAMVYLQSIKVPVIDRATGLVVYRAETLYKVMKWYHIFAFLWVSHFAIACQHYVIGASVTKWYFSSDRYRLASPIGSSVSELILYYLGSVALGSFLVAVFKVIRIITKQIQFLIQRNCITNGAGQSRSSLLPDAFGGNSTGPTTTTSCCGSFGYVWRLFIWFFDKIVVIISRDAYVEIAIHGDSFVMGAQRAFNVLASNPLRLLAIKTVSSLLLTVSKICVVFGTISMATLLIEEKSQLLNYSWSPIIISAMYAYIVAHWFLSVYEMVIDALFICYCEDYERSKFQEQIVTGQGNDRALIGSQFMSRILNNNNVHQLY